MPDPATIDVRTPQHIDRWRPLAQWLLAVPHLIVAGAMEYLAGALWFVSWVWIVFTGRLPAGIASLQVMIIRYTSRAHAYAGFLHDGYPPFEFAATTDEPGGTPVDVTFAPTDDGRDRLTCGLRFVWAIPAVLFALLVAVVGVLAWIAAFFAVLATGRWPDGLRAWVARTLRVWIRVQAYVMFLTDDYPPFTTA